MKQLKLTISSIVILFVVVTSCNAQLAPPFNVRNEHITSLYLLSPKQVDSYNKVLTGIFKQWDTIKNAKYPIKSRRATEEKLQGEFCANVEAVFPEKQFNLWKKNHGGNLATRFYKEDLGMTDEQFVKYRNISAAYANRKKEIKRMNLIESEDAECRQEAFDQYSSSLHTAFSKKLADYLLYENVILNTAKTFSKTYTIISESKAIKCAILKVEYDKDRKELEKQNLDRNQLRKMRDVLTDKYEHSVRQILTNEEYVACTKGRDKLTDSKLKQTYNMSGEQLAKYKELKKNLAMKELVIKQRKEDRNKKEEKLRNVEKEFEIELQKLFSPQQYERWQRDEKMKQNKQK